MTAASASPSDAEAYSQQILDEMASAGIETVCTLPETWLVSLLRSLEGDDRFEVVRVAREEEGIGIMAGSYFAGSPAALLMSNSGFMTCACALNGLAKRSGLPMLLVIAQRGQIGETEVLQGQIDMPTRGVLDALGIRYFEVHDVGDLHLMGDALRLAYVLREPVAVLVSRPAFLGNAQPPKWFLKEAHPDLADRPPVRMQRRDALELLHGHLEDQLVVSHFGPTRAEWHEISEGRQTFFLYGGMGMASSVALGLALQAPQERVWCFEGDGALALNLGSLLTVAQSQPDNLIHFVMTNRTYDAVGSTPLVNADSVDFAALARAAGLRNVYSFTAIDDLKAELPGILEAGEYAFVNLEIDVGSRATRKMPWDPLEAKYRFARTLEQRLGKTLLPQ